MSTFMTLVGIGLALCVGVLALIFAWPFLVCYAIDQPAIGVVAEVIWLCMAFR